MRQPFRPSFCLLWGIALFIAVAGCQRGPSEKPPGADAPGTATVTPPKANPGHPRSTYRDVAIVASFAPAQGADELSWNTHIDYIGRVDQQFHDPNPRVLGENFSTRNLPQLDSPRLEALVGRIESSGFFDLQSDYPTKLALPIVGPAYTLSVQYERSDGTSRHHTAMVIGDGGKHPDVAKFWAAWKAVLQVAPPPVRGGG